MDNKQEPGPAGAAVPEADDSGRQPPLELLAGDAPAAEARPGPATDEISRLESELAEAARRLERVEANRSRLAEQAKNLLLLDSLTIDNWADVHQRLALETKQADDDRQRLAADCRRLEAQLAAACRPAETPPAADRPVDLAA